MRRAAGSTTQRRARPETQPPQPGQQIADDDDLFGPAVGERDDDQHRARHQVSARPDGMTEALMCRARAAR